MKILSMALVATSLLATPLAAAEHRLLMLNYGKDDGMVFEPGYLKAEPGDTITFVPKNTSHFVQSFAVPDGAAPWRSKADEEYTVTVDKEGVYLYVCPPHLMMSMIGVVRVGKPVNIDLVRKKSDWLRSKLVIKGERLDVDLNQIREQ